MRKYDRRLAAIGAALLASLAVSGCYDHGHRPGHASDHRHGHGQGDHDGYGGDRGPR